MTECNYIGIYYNIVNMNQVSNGDPEDTIEPVTVPASTITRALVDDAILRRQESPRWTCVSVDNRILHFHDDPGTDADLRLIDEYALPANTLRDELNAPSMGLVDDAQEMWFVKQCLDLVREEIAGQTVDTVAIKGRYPDFTAKTVHLRVFDDHLTQNQ